MNHSMSRCRRKWLSITVQLSLTKSKVVLRFRLTWWPFILLQWRSLCCLWHVCATEFILGIWNYWPRSPVSVQLCSKDVVLKHQSMWIRILQDDYSKKWFLSKYFSLGAYLPYVDLLHVRATSCTQSVIPTSQRVSVATTEIWFAKNYRPWHEKNFAMHSCSSLLVFCW